MAKTDMACAWPRHVSCHVVILSRSCGCAQPVTLHGHVPVGLPYTVCRGSVYGVYTPYPVYTYTVPRIYRFSPRPGTFFPITYQLRSRPCLLRNSPCRPCDPCGQVGNFWAGSGSAKHSLSISIQCMNMCIQTGMRGGAVPCCDLSVCGGQVRARFILGPYLAHPRV